MLIAIPGRKERFDTNNTKYYTRDYAQRTPKPATEASKNAYVSRFSCPTCGQHDTRNFIRLRASFYECVCGDRFDTDMMWHVTTSFDKRIAK
jgi:predicted RNA-binding Zn-ribbon protein involved in translation (DUF1610 family)